MQVCGAVGPHRVLQPGLRMAAARSSKQQWRRFLQDLVDERGLQLTPRQAWTEFNDQFGADVSSTDRRWMKDTLNELADIKKEADAAAATAAAAAKNAERQRLDNV